MRQRHAQFLKGDRHVQKTYRAGAGRRICDGPLRSLADAIRMEGAGKDIEKGAGASGRAREHKNYYS
jgi:hypothetical protein